MMETIRIRRAGYPIRHHYENFVDRYRILVTGVGPSQKEDCRKASAYICKEALKDADYQLGKTKVFLKVFEYLYYIKCEKMLFVELETCNKNRIFLW